MAIIWAILFTAILPHVRTPTEEKVNISKFTKEEDITNAVRNLPWVKFGGKTHKGVSSREPYITMLSTLLISIVEPESPLRKLFDDSKGLSGIWSDKDCKSVVGQANPDTELTFVL
jgi:hypothetical protein